MAVITFNGTTPANSTVPFDPTTDTVLLDLDANRLRQVVDVPGVGVRITADTGFIILAGVTLSQLNDANFDYPPGDVDLGTASNNNLNGEINIGLAGSDNIIGQTLGEASFHQGDADNDVINANFGADFINAGGGTDFVFNIGGGSTVVLGGNTLGPDTANAQFALSGVTIYGGQVLRPDGSIDALPADAADGADFITGSNFADGLFGNGGDDVINGLGGADFIHGGRGDDQLNGGGEQDVINGGRGEDDIIGGGGADLLTGGPGGGVDTFIYTGAPANLATAGNVVVDGETVEANGAVDTLAEIDAGNLNLVERITDLNLDEDLIDLPGGAPPVGFHVDVETASASNLQQVVDQANLDGPAEAVIVSVTTGGLAGSQFLVVDMDGNGNADLIINVTGYTGGIDVGDFV